VLVYASWQIHEAEPPGDVLVFLPGQEDIEALTELLNEYTPPDDGAIQ
jgi:HrpA-like RNA helicase